MKSRRQTELESLSRTRRNREAEELRSRIFDAARELFVSQGHEAVTVRKIAEIIHYSPTIIYSHYRDKESLIREIVLSDFRTFAGEFMQCAQTSDPWEKLKCFGRTLVSWGIAHPFHYRLLFLTVTPHGKKGKKHVEPYDDPSIHNTYAMLKSAVSEAMVKGCFHVDFTDADLLAQTLWAGLHGVVAMYISTGRDATISWKTAEQLSETQMEILQRGLAVG